MTDKIAVVKHELVMFKALPSQTVLETHLFHLGTFLEKILSLQGEVSAKRLKTVLSAVSVQAGGLSLVEVKEAFMMYVEGKLPFDPMSNYLDLILFNKIIKAYRENRRNKKVLTNDELKEQQDFLYAVQLFDYFVQERKLPMESVWMYTYLETKDLINYSDTDKKKVHQIALVEDKENAVELSKLKLVKRYFEKLEAKNIHLKELL